MAEPHDIPSAGALVEAVREFLERDVMPATEGRVQFHTRVAVNVLGIVDRELAMGPEQQRAHAESLAALGFADESALAAAIRAGEVEGRLAEIEAFVRATVEAKLAVANPKYLEAP